MDISDIALDLRDEQQALDDVVSGLDDSSWSLDTPSPRWSVADQIAHLTYFDYTAAIAISNPDHFQDLVNDLISNVSEEPDSVDEWQWSPANSEDATAAARGHTDNLGSEIELTK